jgi:hypothetical protein
LSTKRKLVEKIFAATTGVTEKSKVLQKAAFANNSNAFISQLINEVSRINAQVS